jgi:hypothetical protein
VADIFREIEDDLKHEQYRRLWRRYGNWIIAIAVVIVLATAAAVGWREYRAARQLENSAAYASALAAVGSAPAEADAALATLAEKGGIYAALARLERAGVSAREGNAADAAQQYRAIADDRDIDPILRNLALTQWATHALAAGEDPATIEAALAPLTDGSGAWRHTARELLAVMSLENDDKARARELFGLVADDPDAPQAMRARASEALAALAD